MNDIDPAKLASDVAQLMEEGDKFSRLVGMKLESVEPGRAVVSLEITDQLVNGHGICHGGVIFSLADTAFAYACNSRNHKTVALGCTISFISAVRPGQRLEAVAQEQTLGGRTGIYDVSIMDDEDNQVALFRGTSYRMRESVL